MISARIQHIIAQRTSFDEHQNQLKGAEQCTDNNERTSFVRCFDLILRATPTHMTFYLEGLVGQVHIDQGLSLSL